MRWDDWLIEQTVNLSLQLFQPLISNYREGNFVYHHVKVHKFISHCLIPLDPWVVKLRLCSFFPELSWDDWLIEWTVFCVSSLGTYINFCSLSYPLSSLIPHALFYFYTLSLIMTFPTKGRDREGYLGREETFVCLLH